MRRRDALPVLLVALATCCLLAVPSGLAGGQDEVIAITGGPSGETTSRDATFTFGPGIRTYDYATCQLDSGGEANCTSPVSYGGLALGAHRFIVRAYSSRGGLLGSDSRSWTIVEGPPPPGPPPTDPPPPTPPPLPPPGLQAKLVIPQGVVPPGGLVELDASTSTGPATQFAFDIDGNGSYETKCESGKAGLIQSSPGSYTAGVLITGASGQTSVAKQTYTIAGTPASLPTGANGAAPPNGTALGSCLANPGTDWAKALICPRTVVVGVAEATPPANAKDACFEFSKKLGKVVYSLKGAGFGYVNGMQFWPSAGFTLNVGASENRVWMILGRIEIAKIGFGVHVYGKKGPYSWKVASPGIVGDVTIGGVGHSFLGLQIPEMTRPVKLTAAKTAELGISVSVPNPFEGIASSSIALRFDNTDGLVIENFVAQLGPFALGPFLELKQAKVTYTREGSADVWSGALSLTFPGDVSAGGQIRFRNGSLDLLSVFLQKENPGYPMGCCIYMTFLQGAYESGAGGKLTAMAVLTFGPSISTPWGTFRLAALNPATLKILLGSFFIEVTGNLEVVGKQVGVTSSMLTDKQFFFYGTLNQSFLGVIQTGVVVQGAVYTNGSWYAGGEGSLCLTLKNPVKDINKCAKGGIALSNNGIAACIWVGVDVGAYIRWKGEIGPFWECNWDTLKAESGAPKLRLLASEALDSVDVRVAPGTTRRLFRVGGRGAPPKVVLTGPDRRRIEATEPYVKTSGHLVLQDYDANATYVAVMQPAAGQWRISTLPGSSSITRVSSAGPLPARIATGSLRRAGAERILEYRLADVRGFTVTFVERGKNVDRLIGRARGRAGTLRFTPTESPTRNRRVEAILERNGIPARTEVVTRFTTPPLRPLPAPLVSVTRRGSAVLARWLPVPGAGRYHVLVTPGDGQTRFFELPARRTSVRVPGIALRAGANVLVRALSREGHLGSPARARLGSEQSVRVVSARRQALVVRCVPGSAGVCTATVRLGKRTIATGSVRVAYGKAGVVRASVKPSARKLVRTGTKVRVLVDVPGEGVRTLAVRLR